MTGHLGRFRVEQRHGAEVVVLAAAHRGFGHHSELTAFAAQLRLVGRAAGEVVLVDEETGAVVARRNLERLSQRRPA